MTSKIIPWVKPLQTSPIEGIGVSAFQKSQNTATTWSEIVDQFRGQSTNFIGTALDGDHVEINRTGSLPIERIYPHVFDENVKAGQALNYLRSALSDANAAIDAFGIPDLQAVGSRLAQIAATMSKVHSLTDFNESLGGVVSFIRRATLAAANAELSRSTLNCLIHALELMVANPMLDLDEATDLVDNLTNEGWHGEHILANELIRALLDDSELSDDELQTLLFPESEAAVRIGGEA
jgi:hypothetical protein